MCRVQRIAFKSIGISGLRRPLDGPPSCNRMLSSPEMARITMQQDLAALATADRRGLLLSGSREMSSSSPYEVGRTKPPRACGVRYFSAVFCEAAPRVKYDLHFCEAAPRVKYDLYLPLKHLQLSRAIRAAAQPSVRALVVRHIGLGAFGLSKE